MGMHYLVMDEMGCTSTVISCLTPEAMCSVHCYFRIFFLLTFLCVTNMFVVFSKSCLSALSGMQ